MRHSHNHQALSSTLQGGGLLLIAIVTFWLALCCSVAITPAFGPQLPPSSSLPPSRGVKPVEVSLPGLSQPSPPHSGCINLPLFCIICLTAPLFCAELSTAAVASHHFLERLLSRPVIGPIDFYRVARRRRATCLADLATLAILGPYTPSPLAPQTIDLPGRSPWQPRRQAVTTELALRVISISGIKANLFFLCVCVCMCVCIPDIQAKNSTMHTHTHTNFISILFQVSSVCCVCDACLLTFTSLILFSHSVGLSPVTGDCSKG